MKWTEEMDAFFRAFVPGHTELEIRTAFAERFGTVLTESQIGCRKTKLGVKSGTCGGRFTKGQKSWNKGRSQAEWMSPEMIERTKATRFKPGELHDRPDGWIKPVGFERVSKDGYIEVKVRDGLQEKPNKNYRAKHHVIWEELHGPIPEHTNIVFADGDKTNLSPENLVAVSRSDWAPIRRSGCDYSDAETLEARVGLVHLSREIRAAEMRTKEAES
ncbi:MAG: HNH endonuclease [Coriobacteriales bacterium]|nr:HNH endonuclease [Coriobacteriales bacterium]